MTHIDPFAPGDSPMHPANFGTFREAEPVEENPEAVRYHELLELYGTDEEREYAFDATGDSGELPSLDELENRESDDDDYRARLSLHGTEEEQERLDWSYWELRERFDFGVSPAAGAVKADWVEYALRVSRVRGEDIPRNADGEPGTIAQLQAYTVGAVDDTASRVADATGGE